nr:MAG TPA: hypothetical protein [Caudoviricetes sp.]DAX34766.1 MAG TPA: hypothetical protein [Caudoviricetes sp.]
MFFFFAISFSFLSINKISYASIRYYNIYFK